MAIVTTGFFDGVHLGHRLLLSSVVSEAAARGEESVVVTFWPHPRNVLQQDARDLRLLTSLQEKTEMIKSLGVDRVEVLPFTRSFAAMTAAEYLDLLKERFGASLIVMGYDNRIGCDRRTASQLASSGYDIKLAGEYVLQGDGSTDFSSYTGDGPSIQKVRPFGAIPPTSDVVGPSRLSLSSTQIRKALAAGDIPTANAMLGYGYGLLGVVVAGNQLGRTIGFPTANMKLYEPLKLVPAGGVYAVDVQVLGRHYRGMTNIGFRPTVGPGGGLTIETNIFDFNEDIYGLDLRITFLRRNRNERKFSSLEELKAQLQADADAIRREFPVE